MKFAPILILLAFGNAWARDDVVPGPRWMSARANAMGDSLAPFANKLSDGLFNQPAALAHFKGAKFEPLTFQGYGNMGFLKNLGLNSHKILSLNTASDLLNEAPGTPMGVGLGGFSGLSYYGLTAGLMGQNHLQSENDGGVIRHRARYELTPAFGLGIPLARGIVRIGYSFLWINQSVGEGSGAQSYKADLAQGSAFSHNVGVALDLPVLAAPSINAVIRNVGGLHYRSKSILPVATGNVTTPTDEPMTIDLSLGIQPRLRKFGALRFSVGYRDVTNTSATSFLQKLTIGAELSIRRRFHIRSGMSSLYPSVGLGLSGKNMELSLSWYGQEVGTGIWGTREDRIVFEYSLFWF